jgi:hypothetical protein
VPRLAAELGLKHLWVKDDGRLPTASFKDRASAIAVVKAREKGAEIITTASTGNAAAALSGLCASLKQGNVIFVPGEAGQPLAHAAEDMATLLRGLQRLLGEGGKGCRRQEGEGKQRSADMPVHRSHP